MKRLSFIVVSVLCATVLWAQGKNPKYEAYIQKYADLAVASQKKHRIPASITLAQGILESAAGESKLATRCNNHFGIKCGDAWHGRKMRQNDDAIGECFRCYGSVKESYDDHAEFLKRQRYSFLYDYEITDYKAWAHGLKRAGYATDPKYPQKLIKIIEEYELHKYDKGQKAKADEDGKEEKPDHLGDRPEENLFGYVEIRNNGVRCYQLLTDDTFKNIAKETGLSIPELLYYNDLPKKVDLHRGDFVYLQPKKNKVAKGAATYVVKAGDSMHSIAQEHGIKLKALYKINGIQYGTPAETGKKLRLRK